MGQKKLNFNQPILSVRRYSPKMAPQLDDERKCSNSLPIIHGLSPHRPESNSGPVRNPGSVPFTWEQIPGRPKEEILAEGAKIYSFASVELPPNEMEALQETSNISNTIDCEECSEAVVDGPDLLHKTDDLGINASKARNQHQEQRRKVVYQDKPILVHCRPKEGSYDGGDQQENVITVCCLLPRSCLKSPFCVNPVPAMRVMNRVMTFPLYGSSTDSENERYAVKPIDRIQTYKLKEDNQHEDGPYLEEFPWKKSFRTLQELLADEEGPKEKKLYVDDMKKVEADDSESDEIETNMISDSDKDWSSEDDVVQVAVKNARKQQQQQLSRATILGSDVPPPPPLPESPTDSWLFRTLSSSASMRKGSSSSFMSRFSNKY